MICICNVQKWYARLCKIALGNGTFQTWMCHISFLTKLQPVMRCKWVKPFHKLVTAKGLQLSWMTFSTFYENYDLLNTWQKYFSSSLLKGML